MKKLMSLISLMFIFSLAVACNQKDAQREEDGMGMGRSETERVDEMSPSTEDQRMEDQRMEDRYDENVDQMNQDTQSVDENVDSSIQEAN